MLLNLIGGRDGVTPTQDREGKLKEWLVVKNTTAEILLNK